MNIREATREDFDQIWPIFHEVTAVGETYAYPRETTKEQALKIWMDAPRKTYVFEEAGQILGTYYIKTNQPGPGDHVCNCGYMVSSATRGRGLACPWRITILANFHCQVQSCKRCGGW